MAKNIINVIERNFKAVEGTIFYKCNSKVFLKLFKE